MKNLFIIFFIFMTSLHLRAQFGIGLVGGIDIYQRYSNPKDNIASPSAGNALLNFTLGPKIWVGGKKFSVSGEIPASIGVTGLSVKDYKGLGMAAVPFIGMLNFAGNSGMDRDGGVGFSLGGGISRFRTELFGLSDEFLAQGVVREWQDVYVAQIEMGFGVTGFAGKLYLRYGWNPDNEDVKIVNVGILTDFNFIMMRKINDPNSAL